MPIPFSLRQLEYFVAIAEHGNVTRAATARNVAQPSVSLALSQLEETIGGRLFHRLPGQGVSITPAGKRLLVEAKKMLVSAKLIVDGSGETDPLTGELSISSYRDIGPYYLPRLVARFSALHSGVTFILREGNLAEVNADVAEGRSELALTYDINVDRHELEMRTVDHLLPHALLPKDHPLTRMEEIGLADLASERLILEDMPVTNEYTLSLFWSQGILPRNIQYVRSFEMQRGLIAIGWGVGVSCVRPAGDRSYDGSHLACRPIRPGNAPQRVVMAHLGRTTISRQAKEFLDMIEGTAGTHGIEARNQSAIPAEAEFAPG